MYEISFNVKLSDGNFLSDSECDDDPYKCILAVHQDIQLNFSGFTNYFYPEKNKEIDVTTTAEIELEITIPNLGTIILIEENNAYLALSTIIAKSYQCLIDN